MGNQSSSKSFKGQGQVLGGTTSATSPTPPVKAPVVSSLFKKKTRPVVSKEEQDERRRAGLAAAQTREKDWEERINKHRGKQQQEPTSSLAWNETSKKETVIDASIAIKQLQDKQALQDSGFDPFQATMASSTAARSAMVGGGVASAKPLNKEQGVAKPLSMEHKEPSVDEMEQARNRLKAAMNKSNVEELKLALILAERFQVPELEEARDLYEALTSGTAEQDEDEEDDDPVALAVVAFLSTEETVEKRKIAISTLMTLLKNLVEHPEEAKFRKVRLENQAIKAKILEPAKGTGIVILQSVGFTRTRDDENQDCLIVPDPQTLTPEIVAYARFNCDRAILLLSKAM